MARPCSIALILAVPTPEGIFHASYGRAGLRAIYFPGEDGLAVVQPSGADAPAAVEMWHDLTVAAVQSALGGGGVKALPPLDWSGATGFQRRVWAALLKIPRGEVRSYAQIARQIGSPGAARAVGAACGANPIPLLVPCHRVVAARGGLGGFSAGLAWKVRLLTREGHLIQDQRLDLW